MSVSTFKASHCGETFTGAAGAKALESHMRQAHGRKMLVPGSNVNGDQLDYHGRPLARGVAAGWGNGEILEPTPWKAPARTPGGIQRVTERIAKGEYAWPASWRYAAVAAAEVA